MQRMAEEEDASGWVNIKPGLHDDQVTSLPEPTPLERWFSGRGPVVPMATWIPPSRGRRPVPSVVWTGFSALVDGCAESISETAGSQRCTISARTADSALRQASNEVRHRPATPRSHPAHLAIMTEMGMSVCDIGMRHRYATSLITHRPASSPLARTSYVLAVQCGKPGGWQDPILYPTLPVKKTGGQR